MCTCQSLLRLHLPTFEVLEGERFIVVTHANQTVLGFDRLLKGVKILDILELILQLLHSKSIVLDQ